MADTRIMTKSSLWVFCLLEICVLFPGMRFAAADEDHELARRLRESGQILALEDIMTKARAIKAGELLETDLEKKQGRYVYEIEILDQAGQVWELELDAATGKLMQMERDD